MQSLALFIPLFGQSPEGGGFDPMMFVFISLFIGIFYFLMLRPQQKRAKEQRQFIEGLTKGKRIVTNGGIHGKIVKVDEHSLLLEVDSGTKLRIERSAISMEMTKERFDSDQSDA